MIINRGSSSQVCDKEVANRPNADRIAEPMNILPAPKRKAIGPLRKLALR